MKLFEIYEEAINENNVWNRLSELLSQNNPIDEELSNGLRNLLSKANTTIGAKTGTAEVSLDGRYTSGVISSNIAVAPADDPQVIFYTVLVNPRPSKGLDFTKYAT